MLFDKFHARSPHLAHRAVMPPMTRSRAELAHALGPLVATSYGQRSGAGLPAIEGTSPNCNGLEYPRISGLFDVAQATARKAVTAAVHASGGGRSSGKIFVQLLHFGRVGPVARLPSGAQLLGPDTVVCAGEMTTDSLGMQP